MRTGPKRRMDRNQQLEQLFDSFLDVHRYILVRNEKTDVEHFAPPNAGDDCQPTELAHGVESCQVFGGVAKRISLKGGGGRARKFLSKPRMDSQMNSYQILRAERRIFRDCLPFESYQ